MTLYRFPENSLFHKLPENMCLDGKDQIKIIILVGKVCYITNPQLNTFVFYSDLGLIIRLAV